MSYQVLARKWRPKSFAEVVGQTHVTRALVNALDQQRLHHAYLFSGTRGIGKTTLARIFAKCLNCETGVSSKPCGACSACCEIDEGRFIDLIEVDAASRTKVEDTRELLNNVQYSPTRGRYKIYLIDEVHMLSGHSFNALLKTLEEPPEHVKFLLATTDPQKLPITVLSRCLQFNLKGLAPEKITEHLKNVLANEQIEYESPALDHISRAADGSIRDALSLLDQAIAYGNNKVTTDDVVKMLGTIEDIYIYELLDGLIKRDIPAILNTINKLAEQAADFAAALESLLTILHQIAIIQMVTDIDYYNADKLNKYAKLLNPEDVQLYYQIAIIGRRDLSYAPTPKHGFEMLMLRMVAFRPSFTPAPSPRGRGENWMDILSRLNISESTKALAAHCTMQEIKDNKVQLLLGASHVPMLNDKHVERLSKAFSELYNKPMCVTVDIAKEVNETPSNIMKQMNKKKQEHAEQVIKKNNNVQEIIKHFNAKIVPDSIINNENEE